MSIEKPILFNIEMLKLGIGFDVIREVGQLAKYRFSERQQKPNS